MTNPTRRTDDEGKIVGKLKLIRSVESIRNSSMVLVECVICGHQKRVRRIDFYKSKGTCKNCKSKKKVVSGVKKKRDNGGGGKVTYKSMKRNARGATCSMCGISQWNGKEIRMDVDHIIPVSRGGSDYYKNLQYLCPNCHRQKTELDMKVKNGIGGFIISGIFPNRA